ncbi:arrestin domain-containing protein 4 [Lepeophtheirus salmonis]|nr:arrestin domain-containing protein 4-like [Lepeophtheirus salmonis]
MSSRKLIKFIIMFDNSNLLFFPGQFLSGRVIVEVDEDMPVLGLFFHVVGEGVVNMARTAKDAASDKENYIDFRLRLLGKPGSDVVLLSSGIHSFPFKLGLPLGLPSTFLGKHGWVQYFCKAALREDNGLTHKNQQVFIIMNPIDLNLEPPILSQPFHCEIIHNIGVKCCSSGPVTCRVRLDRGGYVPGEAISIWAKIENDSSVSIKSTRASLTETIQYMTKSKRMETETRELSSVTRGKIQPHQNDEWNNEKLFVPPLPPTNLRGCHLIRIQYDVFFVVVPNSLDKAIKLQLPIMLATYPLRNDDGTLRKKGKQEYPTTLPIFRPWLDEKTFK